MEIGIVGTGIYIPYYYIKRETIAAQWDARAAHGVRSLCNADEDSVTMAAEAAIHSIEGIGREHIDGLYFASTTAPYAEKAHSSILARVCDLSDSTEIADFMASTRAGAMAVKAAYNAVKAGTCKNVIVTSADQRNGYPKSQQEQMFGDAAAAVVIGSENVAASIEAWETVNVEIHDAWRNRKDDYVRTGESRFARSKGYTYALVEVMKTIMSSRNLCPNDISRVILPASNVKEQLSAAKAAGFVPEQVQDPFLMQVGDCGTAQPALLLAAALENASPGELILWTSYGSGADAILLKVTERIETLKKEQIQKYLDSRQELKGYPRFLSFRGLLEAEPGEPYKINPSASNYWREQKSILSLHGSRCKKCGQIMFPINRICYSCHSKDEFEEICLYDREFKLFTYSIDRLAGRSDDPMIGQAVAEDRNGTRIYLLITDFQESDITIGMPLEASFRKMHELGNFVNYYWKFRPVRKGGKKECL